MKISPRLPLLAALAVLSLFPSSAGAAEAGAALPATRDDAGERTRLASLLRPDLNCVEWQNLIFRQLHQGTILVRERNHRLDRAMYA